MGLSRLGSGLGKLTLLTSFKPHNGDVTVINLSTPFSFFLFLFSLSSVSFSIPGEIWGHERVKDVKSLLHLDLDVAKNLRVRKPENQDLPDERLLNHILLSLAPHHACVLTLTHDPSGHSLLFLLCRM